MAEQENFSPSFYKHFYNETLYVLPEDNANEKEASAQLAAAAPAFIVAGDNRKQIILLVRISEKAFVALAQNQFLQNVLKAINLSMADVALVNILQPEALEPNKLLEQVQAKYLLVFGENVLKTNSPGLYQPFKLNDLPALTAEEIAVIEPDRQKKGLLWKALQQIFLS